MFQKHILTDSEEAVLIRSLNVSVTYSHQNLDVACAVESVVSKHPQTLDMEFRWKTRFMLDKSKSSRLNKDIRILQVDKGNCTMVSMNLNTRINSTFCYGPEFMNHCPLPCHGREESTKTTFQTQNCSKM
jgi:hypothetical protein